MPCAVAVDVNVLDPVLGILVSLFVYPVVAITRLQGDIAADHQGCSGNQRRIDPGPLTVDFAVDIKAEVADFHTRLPAEQRVTADSVGIEALHLHRSRIGLVYYYNLC